MSVIEDLTSLGTAYLDEVEWRFNGRDNPFLFRDTLVVLLFGEPLPLKKLVHG